MRLRIKPTKKQSRQDMIIKLIKEHEVATQDDLRSFLAKCGFDVTQSSLSRDISELGLVKQQGSYVLPPRSGQGTAPLVTSVEQSGSNMIVLKTVVGTAAAVGINIDNSKIPGVIGSLAGDDTVFVATATGSNQENIKKAIRRLFKGEE